MDSLSYRIEVFYSAEDEAYIANVPAFDHLSAHGETPADAVNEVQQALQAVLQIMQEDGKEPPYPDLAVELIRKVKNYINISALAREAGINKNTLATKLRRGTPFNQEEAKRLHTVLV